MLRIARPVSFACNGSRHGVRETLMNDEALKAAVSTFLKYVNAAAQSEIEKAVRNAITSGKLAGHETCTAGVTLSSEKLELDITIYSRIVL
jgi:Family of unknown function (DUF6494)